MGKDVFTTIDQQIEILKERGLSIDDESRARLMLSRVCYYRLSGYSLTLRNHDVFYPDTTFENLTEIYDADRCMRSALMKYLEIAEVCIKSVYANDFSEMFHSTAYLDSSYFCDQNVYLKVINKANEQKEKRLYFEAYLQHFVNDLQAPIPLWAYVDLFTISDISKLYSISDRNLQLRIASELGFLSSDGYAKLSASLHCLTILRNLCAHGSRLFNRIFITKATLNKTDKAKLRRSENGSVDNSHLFGYILLLRRFLTDSESEQLRNDLKHLFDSHSFVSLRHYGFSEEWFDDFLK